ncbi:hypothetical protein ASD99_31085 [Mesorhizobium sp. Root695]|uniref:hypothetical protein n=1 Tax=Mesorhizobium sp. Root695 TaxID=1736589 RepID=UPI00070F2B09|nr:hypothetical protein [Mesorhizobium sp. Root695]KRB18276.1 hypothetical protein ASD99_31085 [Mesorhizobium sp. Root695]
MSRSPLERSVGSWASPSRLLGNLAALILVPLFVLFVVDQYALPWFHKKPFLFCMATRPLVQFAGELGVLITSLGLIIWAVSWFRSEGALGIVAGGVMLFVLPLIMGHYLGATCIP